MSNINVDRAISFVLSKGDSILSSLVQYTGGDCSREQVIEALKVNQREDGGWARTDKDFLGELSNITATFVALQWLNWIGDRNSSALQNTLDYLRRIQREDGSWDEPEEMGNLDPPFWMLPGRYENQLWLTSALCCQLKELGRDQEVDFPRAIEFIRQGWDGERFPEYPHTHWMAMPLLCLQGASSESDEQIIKGCKKLLHEIAEEDGADSADLIPIVYASYLAGDVATDLFELSLTKLRGKQHDDGGWITNHGETSRTGVTVDALLAFKKMGLI